MECSGWIIVGIEMVSGFGVVIKNRFGLCKDRLILSMAWSLILRGGLKSDGSDFVLKTSELVL